MPASESATMASAGNPLEIALARIVDQQVRPAMLIDRSATDGSLHIVRANGHARERFAWAGPNLSWTEGPPAMVRSIVDRTTALCDGLVEVPVTIGGSTLYRVETTWICESVVLLTLSDVTAEYRRRDLAALWSDLIDDLDEIVVICAAAPGVPSRSMRVVAGSASARARLEEARQVPTLGDVVGGAFDDSDLDQLDALRETGGQATWRVAGGRRAWRVSARCVGRFVSLVLQDVSTRASIAQTLTDQARRIAATQADELLVRRAIERVIHELLPHQFTPAAEGDACESRSPWDAPMAVNGQIENLLGGVTRYLDLGSDSGTRQPVHLDDLVDGVLARRAPLIERLGVRIRRCPLPVVWGAWPSLTELFEHLIDNAIAAAREDEPPRIEILASRQGDGWRISVEDDGVGIPFSEHARVFEPLYRVPGREAAGAGMGLAICRRVVARHGGEMGLEIVDGPGIRIWFDLRSV